MFVGELFCLAIYAGKQYFTKNEQQVQKNSKVNPYIIAVPACFDICASTLMFIALTMCAASVYQMMRGFIVVITAIMALFFLGRKQYAHHWISLTTIVLGVFCVGFVSIMASEKTVDASSTSVLGIMIIILAQCFAGGMMVTEEKLLAGTTADPLLIVGLEGFWGCVIFGILLPIF
jgi:drug/metabolite transporter (DMT)-like permease